MSWGQGRTVVSVFEELFVEDFEIFGSFRECEAVSGHAVPFAHVQEVAVVVLAGEVVQHGRVVDEASRSLDGGAGGRRG